MKQYVAVYGSLRACLSNHYLLEESNCIGTFVLNLPYTMISLISFPALIKTERTNNITVEIYEINNETLKRLDYLEGYPSFYNRELISVNGIKAWIYYINDSHEFKNDIVQSGDWKKHSLHQI